jgi:hypothetical protein
VGDDSKEIKMPRAAVVFAVAIGLCVATTMSPSRTAAAPKRHHETVYYTITLKDAARDPRLKARPQQGKKAVVPKGSVGFIVDGPPQAASQGLSNARMRKR